MLIVHCRVIFCIGFHRYSVQLLLKGVEERNMWGENGLIGLEGLRSFSMRRNCNSGSLLYFLLPVMWWNCLYGTMTDFLSFLSKTSMSERAMVIGLGGLNLFGVIILGTMLKYVCLTWKLCYIVGFMLLL